MTSSPVNRISLLLPLLLLAGSFFTTAVGQQSPSYQAFMMQNQGPPVYADHFTLPAGSGDSGTSLTFNTVFRLPYTALPFRKTSGNGREAEFYSPARLSIELFRGTQEDLEDQDDVEVSGRDAIGRAAWADTAWAADYAHTRSATDYLEGSLSVDLQPGIYVFVLQVTRGVDADEQTSRARALEIKAYDQQKHGDILFGSRIGSGGTAIDLLTIGNSVPYAEGFDALVHLPGHNTGDSYRVKVDRVRVADEDTTLKSTVWESDISPGDLRSGFTADLDRESLEIRLEPGSRSYALIDVPNERFPNDMYRMTVTRGDGERIARRVYRSLWQDMPASLLNLDLAVDMLRYIADDGTLRQIRRGSRSEVERKFREFWNERDPTPETEYNELMAEYYRRVDHAFQEYSTQNTPGHQTDQGRIYIRYGEPRKVERTYPAGEPTTEIWIYADRRFVFQATSGFGDFELVNG